jgi:acetyl-CoA carboxylase carboxyl transferase subunit alpha
LAEHSIYSVISPEGCASILWRSADKTKEATEALRLTAQDLKKLGIIDEIVPEPLGGAHRKPEDAFEYLRTALKQNLQELTAVSYDKLKKQRTDKFMKIGSQFVVAKKIK